MDFRFRFQALDLGFGFQALDFRRWIGDSDLRFPAFLISVCGSVMVIRGFVALGVAVLALVVRCRSGLPFLLLFVM